MASSSPPFLGVEMSGLSNPEREGCRNLLGLLDDDEIMALCDTITNRLVQPENRQGKDRPFSPRAAVPPQASPGPQVAGALGWQRCEASLLTCPGPLGGGALGNCGPAVPCPAGGGFPENGATSRFYPLGVRGKCLF